MSKNSIIAILACLVGLLAVALMVTEIREGANGGTNAGGKGTKEKPQQVSGPISENDNNNAKGTENTVSVPPQTPDSVPPQTSTNKPVSEASNTGMDEECLRVFNEKRLCTKRRKHGKERRRVTPRAVSNLPKNDRVRTFENTFLVTGGCEWSQTLRKHECTFVFDAVMIAKSVIEDANVLPGGEIRIEETRTIETAREKLIVTDASLKLDLKSSPIDQIDNMAKTVATLSTAIASALTSIPQASAIAGSIAAGAGTVCASIAVLRKFDGYDFSPMIGKENMIRLYQAFVDNKVKSIKTLLRGIEGKSYLVTYTQEPAPSQKLMQIEWKHSDGTELTAEEDFILSKANIFIDADMLPTSNEEPPVGTEWEVDAQEVASMFCYDDIMTCKGGVKVSRMANRPNGDWYLEVGRNQKVAVRNVEDRTTGSVLVKEGDATLAPASPHQTKTLQVVSSAKVMEFSPQTLLWFLCYDTERGVNCDFKGVLKTYTEEN